MANGAADPAPAPTRRRTLGVVLAVVLIVGLDQLTKVLAVAGLSDGPVRIIGSTVELRLTRNPGGAFGRFQGMTPLLAVAAVAVTIVLARTARRATDRLMLTGLTLVLGGALGNLSDRMARSPGFLRGHVVDFVAVGWWPLFNLADSCITIGAILLVVRTLRAPTKATAPSSVSP